MAEKTITNEHLLLEVDDLLRVMPPRLVPSNIEHGQWAGRAAALIAAWDPLQAPLFTLYHGQAVSGMYGVPEAAMAKLSALLHQMRFDLMMKTRGPLSTVIGHGQVFDYFDELRKIVEPARQDVFFVDPYLDADFVSRYLPHVNSAATVRLLTREKLATLMPSVRQFAQQAQRSIEVRSAPKFHDRYVFVDRSECYQSGASFKDGGRTAPTTLTQITDAFPAMLQTYEAIWSAGTAQI